MSVILPSGDPHADFDRYEAEQERELREFLESCDSCAECGELIQDDCYYDIKGDKWCEHCVDACRKFY